MDYLGDKHYLRLKRMCYSVFEHPVWKQTEKMMPLDTTYVHYLSVISPQNTNPIRTMWGAFYWRHRVVQHMNGIFS